MTVNTADNKLEAPIPQEKVELQQKVDTNPAQQQSPEVKAEDDSNVDPNWKAFREARKKDRADKEAAERRAAEKAAETEALKAALEATLSKGHHLAPQSNEYQNGYQQEETEDERIERRVNEAIARREAAAEQARQQREYQEYPQRLRQQFPDFDQVMAQENLDYLEFHYKELAKPLARLPDGFDKWADIYANVKKFVPNSTSSKKEAVRADINFSKPKSISSTGITQPGEAKSSSQLSEEKRAENWRRMQRTLKSVG